MKQDTIRVACVVQVQCWKGYKVHQDYLDKKDRRESQEVIIALIETDNMRFIMLCVILHVTLTVMYSNNGDTANLYHVT